MIVICDLFDQISCFRAMSILSAACLPFAILMYIVAISFEGDNCTAQEEEEDRLFSFCIKKDDQMVKHSTIFFSSTTCSFDNCPRLS